MPKLKIPHASTKTRHRQINKNKQILKNPNSTHFSLAVLGLDIRVGLTGLKPRAWQGWFLLRVLENLVLPVPLRESPKGEEEGNIQSSGFSDSICSSMAWGADLQLSEGMACQCPL